MKSQHTNSYVSEPVSNRRPFITESPVSTGCHEEAGDLVYYPARATRQTALAKTNALKKWGDRQIIGL